MKSPTPRHAAALSAVALCLVPVADVMAQMVPATDPAATARATPSAAAQLSPVALREVVVTATRFEEQAGDRPVNLSVIPREAITTTPARTLPELLALQPGISVRDLYGGGASGATVDLRGFGSVAGQNTLVLVDGRPLNDADLSAVSWSTLPLTSIERVEILRGSGAVLYGAGASAGVINVITRMARPGERSAELTLQGGSLSTGAVAFNGNLGSGPLALRLYATHLESDGWRANSSNAQDIGQADLRWRDGPNTLTARLAMDRQNNRLPGARRVQPSAGTNQLEANPRGTSTPLDYAVRDGARASLDFDRVLDIGEFNLGVGWRNKNQASYFDFSGFPNYSERELSVLGITPRMRFVNTLGEARLSTTVGVDVYRWDYRQASSNSQSNIVRPSNTVAAAQDNAAFYLASTASFDATGTTVTAGLRRERYKADASDFHDPAAPGGASGSAAPAGNQTLYQHAWELGVRQSLSGAWSALGRAGRSYRFANIDEIYGSNASFTNEFQFLRPQVATGGEVALDYITPSAGARLTLHRLDVDDEIRLDPFTSGIGNTNLPALRRQGTELGGWWKAAPTLRLTLAYTWTQARFREGVLPGTAPSNQTNIALAGRTVPLVPAHQVALGASWKPVTELTLSASARKVASSVMDNDEGNTLAARIPGYTLVDLRAAWDARSWQFALAVNNLFDRSYFNYGVRSVSASTPDRYNAYPLPGRTALATVAYRFQ
ncbi:MAG: TonB-dependent receptor [Rhodocyclaceae bacterium]|nr:TonB-dependent receptor [Rhodocyclaceae bacterium]